MRSWQRTGAALVALSILGGTAACGDDSDTAADATTTSAASKTVPVTAVDYEYHGLPKSIHAGDRLTLTNGADDELHEMVVFQVPASEQRSAAELVALPEAELDTIFAGEPAAVILAPPGGGDQIAALGDGTIKDKGRYVVVCTIPLGADPDAYLNAPPSDGPPQVDGGPPHFTKGMYADLTVS